MSLHRHRSIDGSRREYAFANLLIAHFLLEPAYHSLRQRRADLRDDPTHVVVRGIRHFAMAYVRVVLHEPPAPVPAFRLLFEAAYGRFGEPSEQEPWRVLVNQISYEHSRTSMDVSVDARGFRFDIVIGSVPYLVRAIAEAVFDRMADQPEDAILLSWSENLDIAYREHV